MVSPFARRLRIDSTEMRMPRTIGLPPKIARSAVMRLRILSAMPVLARRDRSNTLAEIKWTVTVIHTVVQAAQNQLHGNAHARTIAFPPNIAGSAVRAR